LKGWQCSHVRREDNSIAHTLAKVALQQSIDQVWIEDVLICTCEKCNDRSYCLFLIWAMKVQKDGFFFFFLNENKRGD